MKEGAETLSKRIFAVLIAVMTVSFTTGCFGIASPAAGILITDVKWAGDAEGRVGEKEGKACARSVLSLVADGDASIEAAAEDGGITNVTSVDYHSTWTLLMGEFCTIVRGN